jgi:NitT/TauT family transport system substrate-binding protein
MKFTRLMAAGILVVLVGMVPPGFAQSDSATLRLDWTVLGYHAPFFLAAARGYYKESSVDVKILEGKGSGTGIQLVGNEADTFAFADAATAAKSISLGVPVKLVMGIVQRSSLSIVFPVDRGIRAPGDLKGRTIVTCAGAGGAVLLPAYLKAVHLSLGDIKLVNTECNAYFPLIAQGKADASISYYPQAKTILRGLGVTEVGRLEFWDAGIILPSHGIVASLKTISGKPDLVRKFVAATAKGWTEAQKNPAAAIDAMVAAFPLLKGKEDTLKQELEEVLKYTGTPQTQGQPFGWQSAENWKKSEEILAEYMGLKPMASVSAYFTNDFIGK